MKYMIKSKILAILCVSLLTLSTTAHPSSWFNDKDLTLTGVYYYPEHWDENQWERDFKKMHELGFEFTHFAEFAWALYLIYDEKIPIHHIWDKEICKSFKGVAICQQRKKCYGYYHYCLFS